MDKRTIIFEASQETKRPKKQEKKEEIKVARPVKEAKKTKKGPLSPEAEVLLEEYEKILAREKAGSAEPNIEVTQVLAPVAFLYERVRNAVDYKGEHLLRRNAIERMLRRQIWERPGRDASELSNYLIRELIWARYIKNDSIPKSKAEGIAGIVVKYLQVFDLIAKETKDDKALSRAGELRNWFFGVASCEIEEILDPNIFYLDVLNYPVFLWFKKHFDWEDKEFSEKDKDIQILIAVHRSLPKSDKPRIRYHLLNTFFESWAQIEKEDLGEQIGEIFKIQKKIEAHLDSPVQPRIYRFVQKQGAAFQVLKEIVEEDIERAEKTLSNAKTFEEKIREVCDRRYDEIRNKVNRGISRSVIYIFSTKVLLALLIEIPYELLFIGSMNFLSLFINTLFPPSLMFLVGLSIKKPDDENTKRIIAKIKSFVYKKDGEEKIKFSLSSSNKKGFTYKVFLSVYAFLFLLTFGVISYFLIKLDFNLLSGVIFFVFLSLVLLFGYRVRFTASELNVTGEREGIISHLFSNITLPFLNLGVWLSQALAKFNFLIVIMDFLIETPLKSIITVFEEWTAFIKEKREEVVEVPS